MEQEIKIVPFSAMISSNSNAQQIATQFEKIINEYSSKAWSYKGTKKVKVEINSGCLGPLFGQTKSYSNYDLIIFTKGKGISHSQIEKEIESLSLDSVPPPSLKDNFQPTSVGTLQPESTIKTKYKSPQDY